MDLWALAEAAGTILSTAGLTKTGQIMAEGATKQFVNFLKKASPETVETLAAAEDDEMALKSAIATLANLIEKDEDLKKLAEAMIANEGQSTSKVTNITGQGNITAQDNSTVHITQNF